MNTIFQHREVHKYTWYGPSMDQKSWIDFCIVSSGLFSDVVDVRVKRGAELSTDHRLVVCSLRLSKPWPNRRSNRSSVTYRIKWEALEDKEVKKQLASSISSKFRQLPDVFEDIEKERLLFRSAIISSAAESCGRKRLRVAGDSEKKTPWWNQEIKEAVRAKKDAFKARLQDRSSSDLQSRYSESRRSHGKSLVVGWIPTIFRLTKYFGRPSAVYLEKIEYQYSIKDSDCNILTDENEILSRWRKYFEDLLNPVKASTRDTYKVTHLGEEEVFTAAEVATPINGIKSRKAAGEDEIRPEMLKALTGEGILWLARVCQVAWKFGKTPRGVIIPIFKKGDVQTTEASNVQTTEGYHSLVSQGKYSPNALKGNAEK